MRGKAWLTLGEAARLLGVSEPTLRKWTDEGRIASFRTLGGHRRFTPAAIKAFRQQSIERLQSSEPVINGRRR